MANKFLYLVLVLCTMFVVLGCATVHRAVDDYQLGVSDAYNASLAQSAGQNAGAIASSALAVVPVGNARVAEVVGALVSGIVSFFTGLHIGRRKRKGG